MAPARVVHQHVDAAQVVDRLVDQLLALRDVAHIGDRHLGAPASGAPHLAGDPLEVLTLAAGEHHVGSMSREQQRRGSADPGASTGDHGHTA